MAIGDLLYEKVIDFSTNPSVPYTLWGASGTAAYEPTSKTLQVVMPNSTDPGIAFTDLPYAGTHDCECELTIKMTADTAGAQHFGIWLLNETGATPTGYRLVAITNTKKIGRYSGPGTEVVVGTITDSAPVLNQTYTLLARRTGQRLDFFVDGVLKVSATDNTYLSVRPGVFLYGCTVQVSKVVWRHLVSGFDAIEFRTLAITAIPANQESRAQFQPQDVAWRGVPGFVYPGPMPSPPAIGKQICKGLDLAWVRDGVQNVLQGYIESTVTISGEGVRRRVLCFDQAGNLVGETMSRASDGKYRFDLLWLNRRYMLVAQDEPAFGPADYNAVAADYQQPTPYAPGQGVGLV